MELRYFEMSEKEINRLKILEKVESKQLTQKQAANLLKVGDRQVRRLLNAYRTNGAQGLISKHRGKPSNHRLSKDFHGSVMALIQAHYSDFGPTLAREYLLERHGLKISVETLRQWMIEAGYWKPKQKRRIRIHQQRQRRACFGELIQLDGSYHDWFEGRAEPCCLLVLIDDASSALVGLLFCEAETTQNYFQVVEQYIQKQGLPMTFYSDKHGVFRVNAKEAASGTGYTQFGRAMKELGIELIHAQTPQAKGRVEKVNRTLQDRLVKAMRLEGINSIEEANAYLSSYIERHNKKFAKAPRSEANAHCPIDTDDCTLAHILSIHSERTLSRNLECSYNNVTYQIQSQDCKYRLQNKTVLIRESYQGKISIAYNGQELKYKMLEKENRPQPVHDEKTLNHAINQITANRQAHDELMQNARALATTSPTSEQVNSLSTI